MSTAALIFGILLAVLLVPFLIELRKRPVDDAARATAPGQFAELSRGRTHFMWHGGGRNRPVAVCVHGLTTPSFVWDDVADRLTQMGFRVLVYDLYGRGFSDRPFGRQGPDFFVRQLDELLAHQGVGDDITLFGYSMGGAIATAFTDRSPHRIRQLVLIAPAGIGGFPKSMSRMMRDVPLIGDWMIRALYPRQLRAGARALGRDLGARADIATGQAAELDKRGFLPAVLSSMRGMISAPQQTEHEAIAAAGIPVLAIWGQRDQVIPIESVGILATWNRDARQTQIATADHWVPITHPDEVANAFRDVLNRR